MNTENMFKAYMIRLGMNEPREETTRRLGHSHKEFDSEQRKPKGAAMMRGIVDYTRSLEDRIMKLEAADRMSQEQPLVENGNDMSVTGNSKTGSNELLLEIKFVDVNLELPGFDRGCLAGRGATGPYRCATGPKHLLRVHSDWQGNVSPRNIHGQDPLPDEFDVMGLGIWSEPNHGILQEATTDHDA